MIIIIIMFVVTKTYTDRMYSTRRFFLHDSSSKLVQHFFNEMPIRIRPWSARFELPDFVSPVCSICSRCRIFPLIVAIFADIYGSRSYGVLRLLNSILLWGDRSVLSAVIKHNSEQ